MSSIQPDPAIRFGRLANGFRFALRENPLPADRAAMYLVVQAGSIHESDDQRGLAHFLEHMLFNGSENFPPGELIDYFQEIGMSFGGDTNAYTTYNETVYKIFLPGAEEKHLAKGLLVMRDYARGALLLEEEIERERGVILAEKAARDSAGYRTGVASTAFSLAGTRIPERTIIGTTEILRNAGREELKRFYDDWYRPDNMILVMVGDFDLDLAAGLITDRFEGLSGSGPRPACPDYGAIDHAGTKTFFYPKAELGYANVSIEVMWNAPVVADTLEFQTESIRRQMAARIVNNRLKRLLEDPDAPFSSASFYGGVMMNRFGFSGIQARSTAADWRDALGLLDQRLRQALEFGFSDREVARVKSELTGELEDAILSRQSADSRSMARQLVRQIASNRVSMSPEQRLALLAPVIETTTPAMLHGLIRSDWNRDVRLVEVTGDVRLAGENPEAEIAKLYDSFAATELTPPEPETAAAFPYLELATEGVPVTAVERLDDIGASRYHFANGVVLNLKQNDFKKNLINGVIHFGRGSKSAGQPGLALVAEAAVNGSGTGMMDKRELDEALEASSVSYRFVVEQDSLALQVRALTDDTETMFRTIQALLTDPTVRERAYRLSMKRFEQMSEQLETDINGAVRTRVQPRLAGYHFDFGLPSWDQIEQISLSQVREWVAEQWRDTDWEITLVGDFDEAAVVDLTSRSLTSLTAAEPAEVPVPIPVFPAGEAFEIRVDSSVDKAVVYAAWQTLETWSIEAVRRLDLLSAVMQDRLRKRVREALGASYSPSVFRLTSRVYPSYSLLVAQVTVQTDLIDLVEREIESVALSLTKEPVDEEELERAKAPLITRLKSLVQTNRYWRDSVLALSTRYPEQLDWARTMTADYASIEAGTINAMAAAYLNPGRAATAVVRPELDRIPATAEKMSGEPVSSGAAAAGS